MLTEKEILKKVKDAGFEGTNVTEILKDETIKSWERKAVTGRVWKILESNRRFGIVEKMTVKKGLPVQWRYVG